MKRIFLVLFLLLASEDLNSQNVGYDFIVGKFGYVITSEYNKEVELVRPNCGIYTGNIVIPDSVQHNGAFYKVTSLGDYVFNLATFTSLYLPKGIRSIGEYCFVDASFTGPLSLPDSLRIIGKEAFYNVKGVGKLYIPSLVDSIGNGALAISDLKQYSVDTANKYFSSYDGVIYNKDRTKLHNVPIGKVGDIFIIPNGVISVETEAFNSCKFNRITIPNSVERLGQRAFISCTNLVTLNIPSSVKIIKGGVFAGCTNLYRLSIDSLNTNYKLINNVLYTANMDTLISCYLRKDTIIVPEGVEVIDNDAFVKTNFLKVILPEGLVRINERAFYESNIRNIYLPQTLSFIGKDAFNTCSLLLNIILPNSLKEIGDRAFEFSGLREIIIPNSVIKIGDYAFSSCYDLKNVLMSDSLKVLPVDIFSFCYSLSSYTGGATLERIEDYAFYHCDKLRTKIVFPKSLKYIGEQAFAYTVPNEVKFTGVIDTIGRENFDNLRILVLQNSTPPFTYNTKVANSIFKVSIPCGTKENYLADPNWSSFSYRERCDGVEEGEENNVKVTSHYRSIEVYNAEGCHVAIYDTMGRCHASEGATGQNIRHYSLPTAGMYVVRVNDRGYKVVVR